MTKIKIKKPSSKDIPVMVRMVYSGISEVPYYSELAKKIETEKYNLKNIRKKIRDKNFIFYIAESNNEIVGMINGHYDEDIFWISWLIVKDGYRRQGLGMRLLQHMFDALKKKGVHKVWFDTRTKNKESIPLVKKLGCNKIGVVKNHWYNLDYFLWEKNLV